MRNPSADPDTAPAAMMLAPADNVAVALRPLLAGESIALRGTVLRIDRNIAIGHKLASTAIATGDTILKYNCPIGIATQDIAAGAYVHTHNVKSGYLPTYTLPG